MAKQRKRARKVEGSVVGLVKCMATVVERTLLLTPLFFIFVICFWAIRNMLPLSVLHVCLSSSKLNRYCLSASTTRFPLEDGKISLGSDEENQELRLASSGLKLGSPLVNETVNALGGSLKLEITDTNVEISSPQKFGNVSNELTIIGNKSIDGENVTFARELVKIYVDAIRSESMPPGMKDPRHKQCRGRQIYVYDMPKKFNSELLEQCHSLIPLFNLCDYFTNGGMGKVIEKFYEHWYQTYQYALEIAFHSRISKHPCLISNPEEANLFYIPFYGGLDVLRWNFRENISSQKRDELAMELANWLQGQPWWRRYEGRDHVLVLGKISWDFRRFRDGDHWGSRLLHLPEMQLVTKLLIERHPWDVNEIGVPHPTFFHPRSDKDIWQWQWQINTAQRSHLISFAGAPRLNSEESIRSILIDQCLSRPESCEYFNCNPGVCETSESAVKLFMKSEFCLQPTGDSPTRRSFFDSLIAGCIPVLFNPLTAYYQYPWHLPANESSYSVYIPEETVKERKINIIEVLQKIPDEQRKEMRKTIIQEIMPRVVYGDPDSRFNEFQDAFMISLDNIFWRTEKASI